MDNESPVYDEQIHGDIEVVTGIEFDDEKVTMKVSKASLREIVDGWKAENGIV